MQTFVMFGQYSQEGMKGISAARTAKSRELVRKCGGEIRSVYGLLGKSDALMVVDFPDVPQALKASIGIAKLTGLSMHTSPAVSAEDFDQLAAQA